MASNGGAGGPRPPSALCLVAQISLCARLPGPARASGSGRAPLSRRAALSGSLSASLSAASRPASWGRERSLALPVPERR